MKRNCTLFKRKHIKRFNKHLQSYATGPVDQLKIRMGAEAEKVITTNKLLFARFWQKEDVNWKQLVTSWCNSKTADCRQYKVDDGRDAADFLNMSGCHLLTDHLYKTLHVKSRHSCVHRDSKRNLLLFIMCTRFYVD